MKKNIVEVNLNRLFGSSPPDPNKMTDYLKEVEMMLTGADKETSVLFTGNAPVWLTYGIGRAIEPKVGAIIFISKHNEYLITSFGVRGFATINLKKKGARS